ncbi:MAG: hypothetical protein ACSHX6_04745 [Akkermansiaceae bacterium]
MKNILFASLAAGSLLFTSCGDKKADTGVEKSNLAANEAVENWKIDVTEGNVASLWDSFPGSYQSDVSGIVHGFGEKVDAEVYNKAMETVSAATKLLADKKSIILELAKESAPKSEADKVAKLEASYDSVVGLLNAIATSDAKDVDGLKKLDMAKFLGGLQEHTKELTSLSTLADDDMDFEKFKAMTATLVSESGDAAEVEVALDDDKETVKLVKKEDRWIPEDMAKDWPKMIEEANGAIGEIAEMKPVQKAQIMAALNMAQASIKELEGAKTKEELQSKVGEIMGQFMGM